MVAVLKNLGNKAFGVDVLEQRGLRRLFVKLERNDVIGSECAGKLAGHNDGVPAVRTVGCAGCFVGNNFTAAAFAGIDAH